MYKLIAIWSAPKPEDEEAFEQYYRDVHAAAAARVPGMSKLITTRTDAGLEGSASAFYRVAELVFDSKEALEKAEHSEEWTAMRVDAGKVIERFGVSLTVGMGVEKVEELAQA